MAAVKVRLAVAIPDQEDNILFKNKGLLQDDYMTSTDDDIRSRMTLYPLQAKAAKKESCFICFDDDIDSDLMFPVDECGHRFCFDCVKQHIEVKLLDGTIPNCLEHRCESQLPIDRCGNLLTLKLSLMWNQRLKEESTPLTERVYCPYQSFSYLMSKTELSSSVESGLRRCFKCDGSFCLHCKVPWHSTLSCSDYKCGEKWNIYKRCISYNFSFRCGYAFCYKCGEKWSWSHVCRTARTGRFFRIMVGLTGLVCQHAYT